MPKGELAIFDEGKFEGTIDYQMFTKASRLDLNNREVSFPITLSSNPQKLYVMIQTKYNKSYKPRWRIWLDSFSLTKEFKPNVELDLDDKYVISTIIYDLTPIIKEGKHELVISHSSINSLELLNVSTISFYKQNGFSTTYKLSSGPLVLSCNEKVELELLNKAFLVARNESKFGNLKFIDDKGDIIYVFNLSSDSEELEIQGKRKVIVTLDSKNEKDYGVILASYNFVEVTPKIDLDIQSKSDSSSIIFDIRNVSEIELDKVIINVFVNGAQVHFKVVNNMKRDANLTIKLPLQQSQQNKKLLINMRVVGIKGSYRRVFDRQITL